MEFISIEYVNVKMQLTSVCHGGIQYTCVVNIIILCTLCILLMTNKIFYTIKNIYTCILFKNKNITIIMSIELKNNYLYRIIILGIDIEYRIVFLKYTSIIYSENDLFV